MLFLSVSIVICVILLAVELRLLSTLKRPAWAALKSAAGGIAAVFAVNSLSSFTGVSLAVNYVTAALAALLGLPGAVLLLFTKLLFAA